MASIQIFKIQFINDSPDGGFVKDDVLDIYADTDLLTPAGILSFTTTGLSVNLNGSLYVQDPSNYNLLFSSRNVHYVLKDFGAQFCLDTTLVVFQSGFTLWPYAYYYGLSEHYSCTINSPTCDLIVLGVPSVVPATEIGSTDGQIDVIGESTNNIQYKLGSDFVYDDGTAQGNGTFGSLLSGSYRVFLRDSKNCSANILVFIPVNNSYGPKFRLEYQDLNGWQTRIDLTMRGYTDIITEIKGSNPAFVIQKRGEGSQDKFEPMLSMQADLSVLSLTDLQFLELYTNDPNLYRINYSKDFGMYNPPVIGWAPALMTDIGLWTNINNAGPAWDNSSGDPFVNFNDLGLNNTSDLYYTDYAFEEGREYSFDYTFASAAGIKVRIKIFNAGGEISSTEIIVPAGSKSGTFNYIASADAIGIGINAFQAASCGASLPDFCKIFIRQFDNTTPSTPDTPSTPIGFELKLVTKVLPQLHQEEYKAPPYNVSISSSCGLPELKDFFLVQPDGQKYYGTISLIELISICLKSLKLDLNIRCGINLYAVAGSSIFGPASFAMESGDEDDPLDQAYIDFKCFYLAEDKPTFKFVLTSIMEAFGAQIIQWENKWNILRVEELISDFDYREFDKDGNYILNGTYSPVIDIDFPSNEQDLILVNSGHNLEIRPGYGLVKMIYKLGLKSNIIKNGDFRLKPVFNASTNTYSFEIDKQGFTLVNAGYVINESVEVINEDNVAYQLSSGSDTTGEAYVQTDTYFVKMGTHNELKIGFTCKVSVASVLFAGTIYKANVPYTKLRVEVKYGSLYLQSDGTWSATENKLIFFIQEFNKYLTFEIVADQPTSGTPIDGMDFSIKVYQAYPFYTQFSLLSDLKAFGTYSGGQSVLPTGYKTELNIGGSYGAVHYFELNESTDAPDDESIVRPDDYNGGTNPRQWILKSISFTNLPTGTSYYSFLIDKITVGLLTDGNTPIDTIVRSKEAEPNNNDFLEKTLVIGSYSTLIVTDSSFGLDLGFFYPGTKGLSTVTTNILTADLIYTGYLRDVNGNGFEFFARDGISENDKLHGILLKTIASQYRRQWRLLRGDFKTQNIYFGMLNTAREVNDNNRVYLPVGVSFNDFMCTYSAELLELNNSVLNNGSDSSTDSPYSSGFSTGFGASGFN